MLRHLCLCLCIVAPALAQPTTSPPDVPAAPLPSQQLDVPSPSPKDVRPSPEQVPSPPVVRQLSDEQCRQILGVWQKFAPSEQKVLEGIVGNCRRQLAENAYTIGGFWRGMAESMYEDEISPSEIKRTEDKSQKRIGYRVNGKNGFVREHGSDQSTSGLQAKLNSQRNITMAEIIGTSTTTSPFAIDSELEQVPLRIANAPKTIRIASHG